MMELVGLCDNTKQCTIGFFNHQGMCDAISNALFTKILWKFMKQAEQMQESGSTIKETLLWAEAYSENIVQLSCGWMQT